MAPVFRFEEIVMVVSAMWFFLCAARPISAWFSLQAGSNVNEQIKQHASRAAITSLPQQFTRASRKV
jgi:hypothetical protein